MVFQGLQSTDQFLFLFNNFYFFLYLRQQLKLFKLYINAQMLIFLNLILFFQMTHNTQEKITLKKYLNQYTQLKKIKSTGDLMSQHTPQHRSFQEVAKLMEEKIQEIKSIILQKNNLDHYDKQILKCTNQVNDYLAIINNNIKKPWVSNESKPFIIKQINPEKKIVSHDSYNLQNNMISQANLKTSSNKKLLSPFVLNKNCDSLMISQSQFGSRQQFNLDDGKNIRFSKVGFSAENSAKSMKKMDIENSLHIYNKYNTFSEEPSKNQSECEQKQKTLMPPKKKF